jgi:hypothetical protein
MLIDVELNHSSARIIHLEVMLQKSERIRRRGLSNDAHSSGFAWSFPSIQLSG